VPVFRFRGASLLRGRRCAPHSCQTVLRSLPSSLRILVREPAFSAGVIFSLALGVSLASGIISIVDSVRRGPLPYANADRVEHLRVVDGTNGVRACPCVVQGVVPAVESLRDVASVGTYTVQFSGRLRSADKSFSATVIQSNLAFPRTLGVRMALGRAFDSTDRVGSPLAMLSHALWTSQFSGDSAIVGRAVEIDGVVHSIVGVLAHEAAWPRPMAVWTSGLSHRTAAVAADQWISAVALLRPGVNVERARVAIASVATGAQRDVIRDPRSRVDARSFRDHLMINLVGPLSILAVLGVVIALISAVNFAGLLLARGIRRRSEISVRAVLGASVPRLVGHIVGEAVVLCVIGGAIAAIVAPALIGGLSHAFDTLPGNRGVFPAWVTLSLGWGTVLGSVALATLLGVVSGLGPAIDLARPALGSFVRLSPSAGTSGRGAVRTRASLVAIQVCLATTILVYLAAFAGRHLIATAPRVGFPYETVLQGWVDPRQTPSGQVLDVSPFLSRIRQMPGVIGATALRHHRYSDLSARTKAGVLRSGADLGGAPMGARPQIDWLQVASGFPAATGMSLASGRFPTEDEEQSGASVGLVTRELADRLFGGDALGGEFVVGGAQPIHIIGIVENIQLSPRETGPLAKVALISLSRPAPMEHGDAPQIWIRVAGDPDAAARLITKTLSAERDAVGLMNLHSYSKAYDADLAWIVAATRLALGIVGLAIVLAGFGLYGMVSYTTEMRSFELAIRQALGASKRRVTALVLRGAAIQALFGVILGTALGWAVVAVFVRGEVGRVARPALSGTTAAIVFVALTLFVASIGPLRGLWRQELATLMRRGG
jgi:putative ABC transport system permease protein